MISYEELKKNKAIRTYITKADESLITLGYTEHSFAHVCKVAEEASAILKTLGYDEHTCEITKIAGISSRYRKPREQNRAFPERRGYGVQNT